MASTSSQRLLTACSAPCCRSAALQLRLARSRARTYATEASSQDINGDAVQGSSTSSVDQASSSTDTSSSPQKKQWKRPLERGALPAYDAAVAYIAKDGKAKREQAEALQKEIDDPSAKAKHSKELRQMRERIQGLQIAAEVNDPETRWRHRNGQGELSFVWHLQRMLILLSQAT